MTTETATISIDRPEILALTPSISWRVSFFRFLTGKTVYDNSVVFGFHYFPTEAIARQWAKAKAAREKFLRGVECEITA
jgi:hypothetical protein